MNDYPETNPSLIRRLTDSEDGDAWEEFVAVYSPLVYQYARQRGFQHADAENIVQEVLISVGKSARSWTPDPDRGRFRTWLFKVTRNLTINLRTRPKHRFQGSGDTRILQWLQQLPDPATSQSSVFETEYRKQVFQWAAKRVRNLVSEAHWNAFWMSSVEEGGIPEVAERLGISVGAVYIARTRVMARLQDQVHRFEAGPGSGVFAESALGDLQ